MRTSWVGIALLLSGSAAAAMPPVGQCLVTRVASVESRLERVPESGSEVSYTNGMHQVSYSIVPAMAAARVGDPVKLCVKEVPKGCPPGDERGIDYRTMNLRTGATWEAADSEHECGGA